MTEPAQEKPSGGLARTLIPIGALIVLLAAGAVYYVLDGGSIRDAPSAQAQGMRADALAEGLDRTPAPDFRLTDAVTGETVDNSYLDGRPAVVTFLYTHCPDVCILIGQEIRDALELMGQDADEVAVVAISVDPTGDTQAQVQEWLDRHRIPDNFRYLIGTEQELIPVWRRWFVLPQDQQRLNVSLHTASVWLIDREGLLRAKYSGSLPIAPEDLAHDLEYLLSE